MLSVERELLESFRQHLIETGHIEKFGAALFQLLNVDKPAAQHQGEPVAWLNVATGHVTTSAVVVMDWDDEKEQVQSLYAEQPAPVAHTMRSVMDAVQQARGFPMLTSNQCHALAEALNGVKP